MSKIVCVLLLLTSAMLSQSKPEPLDGPNRPFQDDLLDSLQGQWTLKGTIAGHPGDAALDAAWVLNHQFLKVHEKGTAPIPGRPLYEAEVYIGYDNASERYVAHWIDIYGGRFSETLGYGTRSGNSIRFTFEYPDGPFHNTFIWDPDAKRWRFLLEQKNEAGKWGVFADRIAVKATP
jgi:Protein of unknown function (DUF1579)